MNTSSDETDEEPYELLSAFALRLQDLAIEFSGKGLDVATLSGALIGSGLEVGLRNGFTEDALLAHFDSTVQKIKTLIAEGAE